MGLVNEVLVVTLAAQITTTPLILYTFGRLSLITLVTNFLILPANPGSWSGDDWLCWWGWSCGRWGRPSAGMAESQRGRRPRYGWGGIIEVVTDEMRVWVETE